MNLPVDSKKLMRGLVVVGVLFVISLVGVGGYYLGMRTAVVQLQESATGADVETEAEAEGPSYLKNPFSAEESGETTNPFYQNPFRTIKGLYTERSR